MFPKQKNPIQWQKLWFCQNWSDDDDEDKNQSNEFISVSHSM